jgi:hypothetical protein
MKTNTINTPKISKIVNSEISYKSEIARKVYGKSGNAVKALSLKNGGLNPYSKSTLKGSPVVITSIGKFLKKDKFTASEFLTAIDNNEAETKFIFPALKDLEKRIGKEYGNYKTFINRLKSDIRKGALIGFVITE